MLPSTSHHVPEPDTLGVPGVSSVQINAPNQQTSSHVDLSKHPSGIVPQLQNVVSTCCLGRKLDLKFIAMHARNAEYNPKRFAAVIMRIREPKTTALIFSSGDHSLCLKASDTHSQAQPCMRVHMPMTFTPNPLRQCCM